MVCGLSVRLPFQLRQNVALNLCVGSCRSGSAMARSQFASGIPQAKALRSTSSGLAFVNDFCVYNLGRPACAGARLLLGGAGLGLLEC
jgi:hypothetical protein